MALYLNGKKLSGDAIAAKPWTTLGTLTEGGSSLNVSGYTELLIYPKINGATYFDPIVIDVSEFNNASTIHFSIYQDNSHSYMGGLDYSDGSISFRRILISGWTSCDCVVKATCFSSGGSTTHHYSENEQVVGTWVNGKTLYEKTWYFQSSMVSIGRNWTSLNIDVSDLDIDEIVNHRAQSYSSQSFSIDVWNDSGTLKAQYWNDGLNIGSVTIQYTKTST